MGSDDQIKFIAMTKLFETLGFINLEKRILIAKKIIKSLDLLIETENLTNNINFSFSYFFSYFLLFIESIEESERLFFAQELISSLKKCIICEIKNLILFALENIPIEIEAISLTDKVSIAR